MIEMVRKDGKTCPVIFCDVCGKLIKDVDMGMVSFTSMEEGNIPVKFVHKFTCDQGDPMWQELSHFLAWLLQNVGFDDEKYKNAKEAVVFLQ